MTNIGKTVKKGAIKGPEKAIIPKVRVPRVNKSEGTVLPRRIPESIPNKASTDARRIENA